MSCSGARKAPCQSNPKCSWTVGKGCKSTTAKANNSPKKTTNLTDKEKRKAASLVKVLLASIHPDYNRLSKEASDVLVKERLNFSTNDFEMILDLAPEYTKERGFKTISKDDVDAAIKVVKVGEHVYKKEKQRIREIIVSRIKARL
jgi:histone H3/H4